MYLLSLLKRLGVPIQFSSCFSLCLYLWALSSVTTLLLYTHLDYIQRFIFVLHGLNSEPLTEVH
jgi:hypothetical protein